MHSIPPPRNFLVLSAASSAPYDPSKKFLVLSPTESGPDPRAYDEQVLTDSNEKNSDFESSIHRSNSTSSASSDDSRFDDVAATLPNGFLYLGHTSRRSSQ
ncbi:hypothetical protein N7532_008016 [Penicillium argentinense]|uniref:Uncharacterized protein n=1 Tax=Penicillium argentinense TaxID=1131581 RepID=A0A9W9EWL6_9EURO|nr:uncharacterized protein N7532_008016 [Penicillium argentinense]KAJ5089332.1 hypothetical protein N7532_008016 [Penicillium argentinense]